MAYQAIHPFRPLGIVTEASLAAPFDSAKWASEQSARWRSGSMRGRIDQAREVAGTLNVKLPPLNVPLSLDESKAFAAEYAAKYGVPTNQAQAKRLTESYIKAQAEKAGVPAEMIAAGDLILHPPTSVEDGVKWGESVAKGYAESMGVPMTSEGLVRAGAGMAATQLGVDPAIIDTGISILKDGKIDSTDAANLVVAACTYAAASLGQAIGIPAPIGAMIGSFVSKTIVGVIIHIAGPQERDLMDAAWKKAEKARAARKAECAKAGKEAWIAYLDFWDATLSRLQTVLDQPEIAVALQAAGGVKYFHRPKPPAELVDPVSLKMSPAAYAAYIKWFPKGSGLPRTYRFPAVLYRRFSCIVTDSVTNSWAPRKDGCLYFPEKIVTWGPEWSGLSEFQKNVRLGAMKQQLSGGQMDVFAGPMTVRTDYQKYDAPFTLTTVQITRGGKVNGRIDARALLKLWGVEQFPTFGPTLGQKSDAASVKYASHVPQQWIGAQGRVRPMGDCIVPDEVEALQLNMQDAAVAASEVMQDVVQTAAWQVAAAAIEQTRREAQEKAAAAVQARGALQKLGTLSPAQRQQLVDMQKLAALTPEQQRQLVEYAKAGQAAKEWAALAKLTPEQQKQLDEYAKAVRAAKPPEQQPLSLAVAAKQNSRAVQAKLRQAAAGRRLRWTAVGAVLAVGATWAATRRRR